MKMFKIFWNSFFIQAAWSFENMQAMGFAYAISPALKRIYKDRADFLCALKRHMEFFNTQPYMASPIIGAAVRLEEDIQKGRALPEDVSLLKTSLMGAYGAIGDSYFWGSVKPFAAIFGVVLFSLSIGLWAGIAFLIVYNIPHLWMRIWGLKAGYSRGMDVVDYIKSLDMPEWGIRIRYFTICLLSVSLALYYQGMKRQGQFFPFNFNIDGSTIIDVFNAAGVFGIVIFFAWLMRKGISSSIVVYLIFIVCVVYWYVAPHI